MSARKGLLAFLTSALLLTGFLAPAQAAAAAALPAVMPALQQWQPSTGTGFAFTGTGRIVAASSASTADARTFAADLAAVTATEPVPVVTGAAGDARAGDIFYGLDTSLAAEAYRLTIGPVLSISGGTANGAFWGSRSVVQLLRQSASLPAGTANDKPKYPVRAAAIWSAVWKLGSWQAFVRELSYLKLNQLQFQSRFAGLSKAQIGQLQTVADQYHVTLMDSYTPIYGQAVPDQYELVWANGAPLTDYLDISNPDAVAWAKQQFSAYLASLPANTQLHIVGDEYPQYNLRADQVNNSNFPGLYQRAQAHYPGPAAVSDEFAAFHNQLNAMLKPRKAEMWSDNLFATSRVTLDKDILLDHWIGTGLTPAQLAANGYQLVNADNSNIYYTEGWGPPDNTTAEKIWNTFDPGTFSGGGRLPGGADDAQLAGLKFAFWGKGANDAGVMSAGALERLLLPMMQALTQNSWGSPPLSQTWAGIQPTLQAIGRAPGVVAAPAAGDPGASSIPGSQAVQYGASQQTVATQAGGALLHTYWFPGGTPTTEALPAAGPVTGRPVAYATPNQFHIFARGTNGHLLHTFWDGASGTWAQDDWTAKAAGQGSPQLDIASDPAGFVYGNEQHVFARGTDGLLHHWWWSPGDGLVHADTWNASFTGNPAAYVWGSTQNVVVRGTNGALQHWWWQPGDTNRPQHVSRGGSLAADASPSALGWAEAEQNIFARGTDGHLYRWSYDPAGGQAFQAVDLTAATSLSIAGNPASFTYGNQRHVIFRNGGNGHLMQIKFSPGSAYVQTDWTTAAGGTAVNPAADPSAMLYQNSEHHVFALDSTGATHHWWQTVADNVVRQGTWG